MSHEPDPSDSFKESKKFDEHEGEIYCNMCQRWVKPTNWFGETVCPYHQRTHQTEEGPVFMYDEFDQDGC